MNTVFLSILAFVVAIGILVAVHEWGHYIVARLCGVRVIKFSIGFGRTLISRRAGPDQTEYCIAAIPLGGYVKLLDEREGQVAPTELSRAFNRQPIMSRIAILVAGPAMNFLFAILAYWAMFVAGVPGVKPIIGAVEPTSIAAQAGLTEQDRIIAMGGNPVATWEGTILALLDSMLTGPRVAVEVESANGENRLLYLDLGDKVAELTEPGMLFPGLGIQPWAPDFPPILADVREGEAAEAAGLKPGDLILAADGQSIATWTEWVEFVSVRPGEQIAVELNRAGRRMDFTIDVGQIDSGDGTLIGFIGTAPQVPDDLYDEFSADQRYRIGPAFFAAAERAWSMSILTVRMVARMVTGEVSVKNISGPINIAQYAGYSASVGLASFLGFLAIVSLSLGILNLLPIPVLDGGQIVYQALEAIKGQPLSERTQLVGQQIGIVFLMLIMSFAFYNDLNRFFS